MKRLAVGPTTTPEYIEWWGRRINDNIPGPSQGDSQPTGKHLQKLKIEKLIKGKDKAEGDLNSSKTDYKKLHFSMRTT
ncbi:hypothetical protein Goarm_022779, partial [Gossypium armourianum]|nr:hypothetical protein [Gossypium armourianum]